MAELASQSLTGVFETIDDPIAREIRDPEREARYYQGNPVVPFMEAGDADLELLTKLAKLSPTHSAVMNSIRRFVLGGQFDVVRKKVSGFCRREEQATQVEESEFMDFATWVSSWIDGGTLLKVWERVFDNYSKYGNAFIEVVLTDAGEGRSVSVYNHDVDRCLYLATDETAPRVLLISPFWYQSSNFGRTPDPVPLYPEWIEDEFGSKRTMIHIKNEVSGRDWYGEPWWLACLYYAYLEIQLGQYGAEGYSNGFTGKVFFETFDGVNSAGSEPPPVNPAQTEGGEYIVGPRGFYKKVVRFFTNRGIFRRSVMHRSAPMGAKKTEVTQFKPNTNEKYHEAMARIAEAQIFKAHDWHPALMGVAVPGALGRSTEFEEAFKGKFFSVIKPIQDTLADPLNLVLRLAAEWLEDDGGKLTESYSLHFKNLYADMLTETGEKDEERREATPLNKEDEPDEPDPTDPGQQQNQPNEPNEPK